MPEVDAARIGLSGHSRNGKQALIAAAFDDRISAVVPSSGNTGEGNAWRYTTDRVRLTIELDREEDGRWIAEALELPGIMCYSQTRDEAISSAERLVIEVIADWIAHGELPSFALGLSFTIPNEQLAGQ